MRSKENPKLAITKKRRQLPKNTKMHEEQERQRLKLMLNSTACLNTPKTSMAPLKTAGI
jgi:hypothetical protein